MILVYGDPEVFAHLLELKVRGFVSSMFGFAKEFVCFSTLKVIKDNTFVIAELHTILIKKCNDCFDPSKSFFRSATLCLWNHQRKM